MKNLILYIVIVSFSCSYTAAQKADMKLASKGQLVKKNTLKPQQKRNAVVFNEADMFQMYYSKETKDIQLKKKALLKKIRRGNKKAERDLKELKIEESTLNARNKKALKFSKLNEQIYFKIGPMPPCPRPRDCGNEWLRDLETIIVPSTVKNFNMEAVNQRGQTIGLVKRKPTMFNKDIGFKTYQFRWKLKPKGPITFKIRQLLNNNIKESYNVKIE